LPTEVTAGTIYEAVHNIHFDRVDQGVKGLSQLVHLEAQLLGLSQLLELSRAGSHAPTFNKC
jgi:hypothetical protein